MRKIMILCLVLLAMAACNREPVYARPQPPEGWEEFYGLCTEKLKFKNVDTKTQPWVFTFENDRRVRLGGASLIMEQCPDERSASVVHLNEDEGVWYVGSKSTGIRMESELSDAEALPLCLLYIPEKMVRLRLSNGHYVRIDYLVPEEPKEEEEGEIPVLYIVTDGGAGVYSKEEYVSGNIRISNPGKRYGGDAEFTAPMKIRGRGNSTWGMPKKPYKIKFDTKYSFFGMAKDKEWCLLANYCDKTLLRNMAAMEISRRMGFSWTPGMYPVEVYINNEYLGVYTFCEHKKVSKDRVNIDTEAGDIYFEMDQSQDESVCWTTDHGAPMMFSDPSEPTDDQIVFAKNYFREFETALWDKDFTKAYSYIDLKSFIDNYIIQELTKNVDGNLRKSTFLTLPKGGRLEMYHVWDFDISMGNCDYYEDGTSLSESWKGWWVKNRSAIGINHGWYYRMFMDPDFVRMVKDRWNELYPQLQTIPDYVEARKASMKSAPSRNFNKWRILSQYVWPNARVMGSYDGEIAWFKEFYTKRLSWLNSEINAL